MKAFTGAGGAGLPAAAREEELVVARLTALAADLDGDPDPEFRARTRARLVAVAAVRTPAPAPASPLRRLLTAREDRVRAPWRTRLTAGVAGSAAAVTGLATVVALSADARPGDVLYGVKRGTEQTQLALAGDDRGQTLLAFASTRLLELETVLDRTGDAGLVSATLDTMDAQTRDGVALVVGRAVAAGDSAALDDLAGWTAGQSGSLADLRPAVPGPALDDVTDSERLLARVDARIEALRSALGCASGAATGSTDELGPRPVACAAVVDPPPVAGGSDPGTPGSDDAEGSGGPTLASPSGPVPSTAAGGGSSAGGADPSGSGSGGTDPGGSGGTGSSSTGSSSTGTGSTGTGSTGSSGTGSAGPGTGGTTRPELPTAAPPAPPVDVPPGPLPDTPPLPGGLPDLGNVPPGLPGTAGAPGSVEVEPPECVEPLDDC